MVRTAWRAGFRVKHLHGRAFVLGRDWIEGAVLATCDAGTRQ